MAKTIIASLHPKSGPVGVSINLSGMVETLGGEYIIYWTSPDSEPLKVGKATGREVSNIFTIPPSTSGNYNVILKDPLTNETSSAQFTVVPEICLATDSGPVGSQVTLNGTNFPRGKVSLRYDDKEAKTATASNGGSFEVTFIIPASTSGEYKITTEPSLDYGDFHCYSQAPYRAP